MVSSVLSLPECSRVYFGSQGAGGLREREKDG